jgi:hypothetical protein
MNLELRESTGQTVHGQTDRMYNPTLIAMLAPSWLNRTENDPASPISTSRECEQ